MHERRPRTIIDSLQGTLYRFAGCAHGRRGPRPSWVFSHCREWFDTTPPLRARQRGRQHVARVYATSSILRFSGIGENRPVADALQRTL